MILRLVAIFVVIISVWSAYLVGYRCGSKDTLDWDFSAVIGGKIVPVGCGDSLLRSRLELRPARNVNTVSAPITTSASQR
jgi:hypothetical protein